MERPHDVEKVEAESVRGPQGEVEDDDSRRDDRVLLDEDREEKDDERDGPGTSPDRA
jgi:hypothetical protein